MRDSVEMAGLQPVPAVAARAQVRRAGRRYPRRKAHPRCRTCIAFLRCKGRDFCLVGFACADSAAARNWYKLDAYSDRPCPHWETQQGQAQAKGRRRTWR